MGNMGMGMGGTGPQPWPLGPTVTDLQSGNTSRTMDVPGTGTLDGRIRGLAVLMLGRPFALGPSVRDFYVYPLQHTEGTLPRGPQPVRRVVAL